MLSLVKSCLEFSIKGKNSCHEVSWYCFCARKNSRQVFRLKSPISRKISKTDYSTNSSPVTVKYRTNCNQLLFAAKRPRLTETCHILAIGIDMSGRKHTWVRNLLFFFFFFFTYFVFRYAFTLGLEYWILLAFVCHIVVILNIIAEVFCRIRD